MSKKSKSVATMIWETPQTYKQVKVTIPKWKYEATIVELYDNLTYRPLNEEVGRNEWGEPITQKLTLYYSNDKHIGTWHNGSGWYYEVKE